MSILLRTAWYKLQYVGHKMEVMVFVNELKDKYGAVVQKVSIGFFFLLIALH